MTSSASCLSRAVATICWLCVCAHFATAVTVVVLQAVMSHPLAREMGTGQELKGAQRALVLPWMLVGLAVAAFRIVQPALRAVQHCPRRCCNWRKQKKVKTIAPPPERDEPPRGPPKGLPKGPLLVKRKRNTKRAYPTL